MLWTKIMIGILYSNLIWSLCFKDYFTAAAWFVACFSWFIILLNEKIITLLRELLALKIEEVTDVTVN